MTSDWPGLSDKVVAALISFVRMPAVPPTGCRNPASNFRSTDCESGATVAVTPRWVPIFCFVVDLLPISVVTPPRDVFPGVGSKAIADRPTTIAFRSRLIARTRFVCRNVEITAVDAPESPGCQSRFCPSRRLSGTSMNCVEISSARLATVFPGAGVGRVSSRRIFATLRVVTPQ